MSATTNFDGSIPVAKVNAWWREPQILWLLLLVAGIYFTRVSEMNLAGEETRRAQVAAEMIWSGDWLVPRQQGELYLTRPPLGSWLIAVIARSRGGVDAWSARLPSLVAVLATVILIYGYARNFLSQSGAFLSAAGYATMIQVMQLGRTAETEAVFTFFIAASLLVWHWGYQNRWPAWRMWSAAYLLAALAGLTKGPQGIVYFVGPIGVFLIVIERRWRLLLQPAHFVGISISALTIAAWQVPYVLATSLSAGKTVWFTQASNRFTEFDGVMMAQHMAKFPLEIFACTLPWSLAFLQVFNRNLWKSLRPVWPEVRFLLVALAVTFPTVWLAPHARGRYFMPLYPLIAILAGIILERTAKAESPGWLYWGWNLFVLGLATAGVIAGVLVSGIAFSPGAISTKIEIGRVLAVMFLCVSTAFAFWASQRYSRRDTKTIQLFTGAIACLLGLAYTGLIVSAQSARQPDVNRLLAEVREQVPDDARIESFGRVAHAFTYYYGKLIPERSWPETPIEADLPTYFCCRKTHLAKNPLPFAWEPIAEISFEDDDHPSAGSYVVIARRLPVAVAKANAESSPNRSMMKMQ